MSCNYCNGDEALFWDANKEDSVFIDSNGEIMVSSYDKTILFNVKYCPMCGRSFNVNKYHDLKKGNDIYYVDYNTGEIEHGVLFSTCFKDGEIDSFSVDFGYDFDEFYGKSLGKYFFASKEEAEIALRKGEDI